MSSVWWLPATVLVLGSLVVWARIRRVEREIASTTAVTDGLAELSGAAAILTTAISRTGSRRARVARRVDPGPDREPSNPER